MRKIRMHPEAMSDVTEILHLIEQRQSVRTKQLLPVVYQELRQLAACWMAIETPGQTLQPPALVHEAFLRLVRSDADLQWDSKRHFFVAAATAMRRILIEDARRKKRLKNGGHLQRAFLDGVAVDVPAGQLDLLVLDYALSEFESEYPDKAPVVRLRLFAGLTHEDIAATLGLSTSTVQRYWRFARAQLYRRMHDGGKLR
jgi:RNA polymerase sigma factor (TIGR02999 family)